MSNTKTQDKTKPPINGPDIARELVPDENIVWVGRPDASRFAWRGWLHVCFGILHINILVLIVFIFIIAYQSTPMAPLLADLIVVIFFAAWTMCMLAVCVFVLLTPFWLYRYARRAQYVITNHRCIIWRPNLFRGGMILSISPRQLYDIESKADRHGHGDLLLDPACIPMLRRIHNILFIIHPMRYIQQNRLFGFFSIKNVYEVEEIIRHTLKIGGKPRRHPY